MAEKIFLGVDCTQDNECELFLFMNTKIVHEKFQSRAQSLAENLETFLDKNKIKLNQLCGILVVNGKGSFMANRMSTTFVNGLAYSLQILAKEVDSLENFNLRDFEALKASKSPKNQKPQEPSQALAKFAKTRYYTEPNITIKKAKK